MEQTLPILPIAEKYPTSFVVPPNPPFPTEAIINNGYNVINELPHPPIKNCSNEQ